MRSISVWLMRSVDLLLFTARRTTHSSRVQKFSNTKTFYFLCVAFSSSYSFFFFFVLFCFRLFVRFNWMHFAQENNETHISPGFCLVGNNSSTYFVLYQRIYEWRRMNVRMHQTSTMNERNGKRCFGIVESKWIKITIWSNSFHEFTYFVQTRWQFGSHEIEAKKRGASLSSCIGCT